MKSKNLQKESSRDKFMIGLNVVLFSIIITMIAFITEDKRIIGLATLPSSIDAMQNNLIEFNDVDSLTLGAGTYYIDSNGIVYWADDESMPAVAKLKQFDIDQENKYVYIDKQGRIGYLINSIQSK